MSKPRILRALFAYVLAVFSVTANASLVIPDGLNPGDMYHVIFVSSTTRDATSSDITDYDAHVQAAADAAGIGGSITWLAVGSTTTDNAIDHLASLFSSTTDIPIYNQNGDLISANFDGLWDGSIDNAVSYTENGSLLSANTFTGTLSSGVAASGFELGSTSVIVGSSNNNSTWLNNGLAFSSTTTRQFYGLSSELLVTSTPIPAAVWLFGSGLLGLVGMARRKT